MYSDEQSYFWWPRVTSKGWAIGAQFWENPLHSRILFNIHQEGLAWWIFISSWVGHLRFLIYARLWPRKAHLSIPSVLVCSINSSCRLCAGYRTNRHFFGYCFAHVINYRNFSGRQSPLSTRITVAGVLVHFGVFHLFVSTTAWSFPAISSTFSSDLKNNFTIEFSDFLHRIGWMKRISWTQNLFGFRVPNCGLLTYGGLKTPKGIHSECTFSTGITGLQEYFTVRWEPGTRSAILRFWLCPFSKFPEYFGRESPLPTHLWLCEIMETHYTGVVVYFMYHKKKTFRLAWSRPCHEHSQTEHTTVFCATTGVFRSSFRSADIGRMAAEKPLTYNRGQPLHP